MTGLQLKIMRTKMQIRQKDIAAVWGVTPQRVYAVEQLATVCKEREALYREAIIMLMDEKKKREKGND